MAYADVVLADRPRALWMLDETMGTAARDLAAIMGVATVSGSGITYGVSGPSAAIPRGMAADGVAGVITLPSLSIFLGLSAEQTWEIWANSSVDLTTSTVKALLGNASGSQQALLLGGDATGDLANEVSTVYNAVGGAAQRTGWSGFTVPAGWHHHVWVYNGTQNGWTYYLDGLNIMMQSGAAALFNSGGSQGFTQGGGWQIARNLTFYQAWAGLAGAAVYDRALTAGQVAGHYVAGRNGHTC